MTKPPKTRRTTAGKPGTAATDATPEETSGNVSGPARIADPGPAVTASAGSDDAASGKDAASPAPATPPEPATPLEKDAKASASDEGMTAKDMAAKDRAAKKDEAVEAKPAAPFGPAKDDRIKGASATSAGAGAPTAPHLPATARETRSGALAAGVAGGLVVLVVGGLLQWGGILPGFGRGEDAATLSALETEVEELRAALAAETNERMALAEEIAQGASGGLEDRVAALETAIEEAGNAPDPQEALAALEEQLASAGETASANQQSLEDLAARVEALEQSGGTEHVLAAAALKAAIDRGEPFAAALDNYANVAGDTGTADALRDYAEAGVPTQAELVEESEAAVEAMLAATRPAGEDAGVTGRLWSSAQSLFSVRQVGMVEGEAPEARIARIEAHVKAGDYDAATAEYEALPENVRAAGAAFMDKVRARAAAAGVVDQAIEQALSES